MRSCDISLCLCYLNFYEKEAAKVVFQTLSGDLVVERHGDLYEMDFPAYELNNRKRCGN